MGFVEGFKRKIEKIYQFVATSMLTLQSCSFFLSYVIKFAFFMYNIT